MSTAPPAFAPGDKATTTRAYFYKLKDAATSTFEGMAVTFANLLRRPITVQYPDRLPDNKRFADMLPVRSRGFLEVDTAICTACRLCERACPIGCIQILLQKRAVEGSEKPVRGMAAFDIDLGKCMYCSLCCEPCPTGAIRMSTEFEAADPDLEVTVFRFVPIGGFAIPAKAGKKREFETPPAGEIARQTMERMKAENTRLFDYIRVKRAEKAAEAAKAAAAAKAAEAAEAAEETGEA